MRFVFLFLIAAFLPLPAHADKLLIYRDEVKGPRETAALEMLQDSGKLNKDLPYSRTAVDLNGDGVDEWIFSQEKTPGCKSNADCTYLFVGLSDKTLVLIGDISARKVGVADEKLYGINKLHVYNNANDDFAHAIYVWNPVNRTFQPQ